MKDATFCYGNEDVQEFLKSVGYFWDYNYKGVVRKTKMVATKSSAPVFGVNVLYAKKLDEVNKIDSQDEIVKIPVFVGNNHFLILKSGNYKGDLKNNVKEDYTEKWILCLVEKNLNNKAYLSDILSEIRKKVYNAKNDESKAKWIGFLQKVDEKILGAREKELS